MLGSSRWIIKVCCPYKVEMAPDLLPGGVTPGFIISGFQPVWEKYALQGQRILVRGIVPGWLNVAVSAL